MRNFFAFILAVFLYSFPFMMHAGEISGAYGYKLGNVLDTSKAKLAGETEDGLLLYSAPGNNDSQDSRIFIAIGKGDAKISRIISHSKQMPVVECYESFRDIVNDLKKRYPDAGYYAMDDSDMFYQEKRSIVVNCKEQDSTAHLIIEYRTD